MGLVVSPNCSSRPPEGDFKHCNWVKLSTTISWDEKIFHCCRYDHVAIVNHYQSLLMMIKHIYQKGQILCRLVHSCIHKMWFQFNIAIRYDYRYFMAIRNIKLYYSLTLTRLLDNLTMIKQYWHMARKFTLL